MGLTIWRALGILISSFVAAPANAADYLWDQSDAELLSTLAGSDGHRVLYSVQIDGGVQAGTS